MDVIEAWDDCAALSVDHLRPRPTQARFGTADTEGCDCRESLSLPGTPAAGGKTLPLMTRRSAFAIRLRMCGGQERRKQDDRAREFHVLFRPVERDVVQVVSLQWPCPSRHAVYLKQIRDDVDHVFRKASIIQRHGTNNPAVKHRASVCPIPSRRHRPSKEEHVLHLEVVLMTAAQT